MSSSDIISRVWSGIVKVQLSLSDDLHQNHPDYCCVIHRNSYIPLSLTEVLGYFQLSLTKYPLKNWWCEYDGIPLKWNLPIGVLYDQCHPDGSTQIWKITLRYGSFPSAYVIKMDDGLKLLKSYWMNQMKEACFILRASSKIMMAASKEESDSFYGSVADGDAAKFERHFRRLLPTKFTDIHNLPIKIHLPLANKVVRPRISKLNRSLTLGQVLQQFIPDLFPSNIMEIYAIPISHAIKLPLESPIIDLYLLLKYMDGFLHIVIRMIERKQLVEVPQA